MAPEEEEEKARLYSGAHSNNAFQMEYYFNTPNHKFYWYYHNAVK